MTAEERAALAARMKRAHDEAQRQDAWTAAADVAAGEVNAREAYIAWLESGYDISPDQLRAMYAGSEVEV